MLAMEETIDLVIGKISTILGSSPLRKSAKFHGCSHDVFALESPSGQKWILRVAKDEFAAEVANRSADIMKHILEKRPWLAIPAVVYADQSFTVLTYIEGTPLLSWNTDSLSYQRRRTLLDGLAKFLHQLWTCPTPLAEPGKMYYICY